MWADLLARRGRALTFAALLVGLLASAAALVWGVVWIWSHHQAFDRLFDIALRLTGLACAIVLFYACITWARDLTTKIWGKR